MLAVFPLFFPLYLLRGTFFGLPVTLPEVILTFMFLYFAIRERIWEKEWWILNGRSFLLWPVLLFLFGALVSVTVAPRLSYFADGSEFYGLSRALGIFKGWILFPIGYFFIARYYFREKPSLIDWALKALFGSAVALAFLALWQVWTDSYLTVDFRASGPFESANYLALYLVPAVVYGIFTLLNFGNSDQKNNETEKRVVEFVLMLGGTILLLAAIYFSKSYAGWISIAGSSLVGLLLFLRKRSEKVRKISVSLIFLLIGIFFFTQISTEKFSQFLDYSNRSSTSVRLQVYEIAWNLIKENPVLGIGLGQFEQVYQVNAARILGFAPFEWVMIHPHNVFLAVWLNLGLLGFCAFLWILYRALGWIFEENAQGRSVIALMLISILIHGVFDSHLFKNDLAFEFWLLMAMLI